MNRESTQGHYEWHLGDHLDLVIRRGDPHRLAGMLRKIADILELQVGGEFIPEIPWAPKDNFIPEIPWNRDGNNKPKDQTSA